MPLHALVTHARPRWFDEVRELYPGAHVAVFADNADTGIEGRLVGLELRDSLLVLRSGPKSSFVFLFRKPVAELTLADQVATTGTGGLNIEGSRVGTSKNIPASPPKAMNMKYGARPKSAADGTTGGYQSDVGRWPPNVLLIHSVGCATGTCEPDCPAKILDELTGELTSGAKEIASRSRDSVKDWRYKEGTTCFADTGGASRFYPRFADDHALQAWIRTLITPV